MTTMKGLDCAVMGNLINTHTRADWAETGTGKGVETRGRTQDGNGDVSGDGNESSSGDGIGDENGTGTGMRMGSRRAEERRRSARNRTRPEDVM